VAEFRRQIHALQQPVGLILWNPANPDDSAFYCTPTAKAGAAIPTTPTRPC
jgi:hypothetical protein